MRHGLWKNCKCPERRRDTRHSRNPMETFHYSQYLEKSDLYGILCLEPQSQSRQFYEIGPQRLDLFERTNTGIGNYPKTGLGKSPANPGSQEGKAAFPCSRNILRRPFFLSPPHLWQTRLNRTGLLRLLREQIKKRKLLSTPNRKTVPGAARFYRKIPLSPKMPGPFLLLPELSGKRRLPVRGANSGTNTKHRYFGRSASNICTKAKKAAPGSGYASKKEAAAPARHILPGGKNTRSYSGRLFFQCGKTILHIIRKRTVFFRFAGT